MRVAPPGSRPGRLEGRPIDTIGYRGMHSYELAFENWWVPDDALVGGARRRGPGFLPPDAGLRERQAADRRTGDRRHAGGLRGRASSTPVNRMVFGRPILDYQLTRAKLGRMAAMIQASRQFAYRVATLMAGGEGSMEASMVKAYVCRAAEWVTREAMQLHGGMGYAEEFAVSRYFVDARVLSIFEGADETLCLKVIARRLVEQAGRKTSGRTSGGASSLQQARQAAIGELTALWSDTACSRRPRATRTRPSLAEARRRPGRAAPHGCARRRPCRAWARTSPPVRRRSDSSASDMTERTAATSRRRSAWLSDLSGENGRQSCAVAARRPRSRGRRRPRIADPAAACEGAARPRSSAKQLLELAVRRLRAETRQRSFARRRRSTHQPALRSWPCSRTSTAVPLLNDEADDRAPRLGVLGRDLDVQATCLRQVNQYTAAGREARARGTCPCGPRSSTLSPSRPFARR